MQIFVEKVRTEQGLSIAELARRANISKSTLHGVESGKVSPKLETMCKIAEALDVPLEKLYSYK